MGHDRPRRDRGVAPALQHGAGIAPISNYDIGAETRHALRLKPDHLIGAGQSDSRRLGILRLLERRPARLVIVALANELLRIARVVMTIGDAFRIPVHSGSATA